VETVLSSLEQPANEADNAGSESGAVADHGSSDAGASATASGDGGGDAGLSGGTSGKGAGGDNRHPDGAEKDKLVPLAALHESREKIRSLTAQIDELKKQPQLSEEERELLKELKTQRAAAKAPKVPEFVEDPKGYIDAQTKAASEAAQAALAKLSDAETKRTEAENAQKQYETLISAVTQHENAFVQATPDYREALQHVRNIRTSQIRLLYPQATDAQISHQISREELNAAHQIIQGGGNPADFAYNYAKTLGYVPKKPAANGNGMASAAAAATGDKPDKDAVRTLGGGGGAEPDDAPADVMPEFTAALKERFTRKRK
jgi:hypothetical protein